MNHFEFFLKGVWVFKKCCIIVASRRPLPTTVSLKRSFPLPPKRISTVRHVHPIDGRRRRLRPMDALQQTPYALSDAKEEGGRLL